MSIKKELSYLGLSYEYNEQLAGSFSICYDGFTPMVQELREFLKTEKTLYDKTFVRKVLSPSEIRTNNQIEGYGEDVSLIKIGLHHAENVKDVEQRNRILNFSKGYHYILKHPVIDKDSVRELYQILSKNLLKTQDLEKMGEYYRDADVKILKNGRIGVEEYIRDESQKPQMYHGVLVDHIEPCLGEYFQFVQKEISGDMVDEYVKSQIMHFYFEYVHPYFDVNSRTSRTIAMWYLINKEAHPFIIFNRGISFKRHEYERVIEDVRKFHELTFFVKYMLKTVKEELEKEYVMQQMEGISNAPFTALDYQTLLYFLTMNGQKTILDFSAMYNRFNDKKKAYQIYNEMLIPLLDKGILEITKNASHFISSDIPNAFLRLRHAKEIDKDKIKRLHL